MTVARKVLAWVLLAASTVGLVLALPPWRLLAPGEPLVVLLLSLAALWYEAFNAVQIATDQEG